MSSLSRTTNDWITIFGKLPAPDSAEEAIANRIIADLWGYDHNGSKWRSQDAVSLANALVAYARLLQEAGVTA